MPKMRPVKPLATDHLQLVEEDLTPYLQPLGTLVLCRPIRRSKVTAAGIHISQKTVDAMFTLVVAEVLAIGPGQTNEDGKMIPIATIKVGDKVAYPLRTKRFPTQFSKIVGPGEDPIPTAELVDCASFLAICDLPPDVLKPAN